MNAAAIVPRGEHSISRTNISDNALKVLYRLKESGYAAYLVGGSVRDLLLGREPKDFDIATDAIPEDIRKLFRNCRLIGRRFRLAHIHFGDEIIEVATFRGPSKEINAEQHSLSLTGMILRDNVYGTLEEDAWRRDFSVNALYYNIADFSVVDFTGGMEDLSANVLRLIGDPEQRCIEDPVRILRAIRFSAKLSLDFESKTESAVIKYAHLIREVSSARLFEEILKLFHGGFAAETFYLLRRYHLFKLLFPTVEKLLESEEHVMLPMLISAFNSTDQRIRDNKGVNPAFLFAVILWLPLQHALEQVTDINSPKSQLFDATVNDIIKQQLQHVSIPRRFLTNIVEIWKLQSRFHKRFGVRPWRLLAHRRFRAAYDFLLLRSEIDPHLKELCEWWTHFQTVEEAQQRAMIKLLQKNSTKGK